MSEPIRIVVYGTAAPAGSKRQVPIGGKKGGQMIMIEDAKKSKPWKQEITQAAGRVMDGRPILRGPIEAEFTFFRRRPKGHFGSGRNASQVRPSAPAFPTQKPDILKLTRAAEDALTGIAYNDDAQIVSEHIHKRYGEPERVEILLHQLNGSRP